jgi:hypothetical protein
VCFTPLSLLEAWLRRTGEGRGRQGLLQAMTNQREAVTKERQTTSASRFSGELQVRAGEQQLPRVRAQSRKCQVIVQVCVGGMVVGEGVKVCVCGRGAGVGRARQCKES